ncbi:hypothetical protein GW17_00016337, partial [Ensete ventricosum]
VVFLTLWVKNYKESISEEALQVNLNHIEERRAEAHLWALAYKNVLARLYNQKGKLAPSWEGPYQVTDVICDRTYHLTKGVQLPRI